VIDRRAAARYAEALFDLARERGLIEKIRAELDLLVQTVEAAAGLRALMERPDVDPERKIAIITAALGGRFSETVLALLGTLIRHRRGAEIPALADAYRELADEAAGVVRAEACTVVPLTPQQKARLVAALGRLTGRKVILQERIDPEVLAGLRVHVGEKLIDGSAAWRLRRMREELTRVEGRGA